MVCDITHTTQLLIQFVVRISRIIEAVNLNHTVSKNLFFATTVHGLNNATVLSIPTEFTETKLSFQVSNNFTHKGKEWIKHFC